MLWLYGGDLGGTPQAVTTADLSLTTITKNGGSPIPLAGAPPMYDGTHPWAWCFIGQPAQDIQIGDQQAACVKTGGGWTVSGATDQSALFQNFNPDWESLTAGGSIGQGQISYSATHTDSAVYTIPDLIVGATYNLYRNSPDVYPDSPSGAKRPAAPRHRDNARQLCPFQRIDHGQLCGRSDGRGQLRRLRVILSLDLDRPVRRGCDLGHGHCYQRPHRRRALHQRHPLRTRAHLVRRADRYADGGHWRWRR